ncbi:hypothetical protein [Microlunatus antarcticus]|uniref:Lipoprotein n=1 Tax=Microlunatus antarcticus TaxID=53388 RepID=A0A7W5JTA2_9ACTN|nr:hypothetical protein [Microlunatus antarcticus]MBB3325818.1 hypothetical protein [Microlunatus antarcticus]
MNLPPSLRRAAVVAALVTVTSPLAACGGGGNTSSWVGTFCGAGSDLRGSLSRSNDQLREVLKAGGAPADVKLSVVSSAGAYVNASTVAGVRVKQAGEPSVDQGAEIEAAVVAKYAAIDTQLKALQDEAEALPTSSTGALADALGPYSQKLSDVSRDVAGSFEELKQYKGYAKLDKVSRTPDDYDTADSCTRLRTVAP